MLTRVLDDYSSYPRERVLFFNAPCTLPRSITQPLLSALQRQAAPAAPAAPAAKVDDDDDDDDLFGDDEEEAAKPAEKSRAEKMAEAKAAKDAKKKVDR